MVLSGVEVQHVSLSCPGLSCILSTLYSVLCTVHLCPHVSGVCFSTPSCLNMLKMIDKTKTGMLDVISAGGGRLTHGGLVRPEDIFVSFMTVQLNVFSEEVWVEKLL